MPYRFQGDFENISIFTVSSLPTQNQQDAIQSLGITTQSLQILPTSLQLHLSRASLTPVFQSPIQTYSHIPRDSSPNASAPPVLSQDTILLLTLIPFALANAASSFKISLNCCLFYGDLMLATCLLLSTLPYTLSILIPMTSHLPFLILSTSRLKTQTAFIQVTQGMFVKCMSVESLP